MSAAARPLTSPAGRPRLGRRHQRCSVSAIEDPATVGDDGGCSAPPRGSQPIRLDQGRAGTGRSGEGEAGFVLVAVLVVLALMAGVVGTASLAARGAAGTARLGADRLEADALADAGIALAGFALYGEKVAPAALDGRTITLATGTVRLTAASEAGRIDLNAATPPLLAGLWDALGRTGLSGEEFGQAVNGWRNGAAAESATDGAAGSPDASAEVGEPAVGESDPAGGVRTFQSVAALAAVGGVSVEDVAALAPYVTIFNPGGNIDPLSAPRAVLEALPGATAADVEQILSLRAGAWADSEALVGQVRALVPSAAGRLSSRTRSHRVRVEVRHPALAPFVVEAVLAQGANPERLYHVLAWRRLR